MPNKYWRNEIVGIYKWKIEYLDKLIDKYGQGYYKTIDDITTANVNHLLEGILLSYQNYNLEEDESDIYDSLKSYFYNRYLDDFPNSCYPSYPDSDRRDVNLRVVNYLNDTNLIPEDALLLINYLHTPEGKIEEATRKMEEYFRQLDFKARSYEGNAAYQAIEQQRAEAEAKGEKRPIRPSKRLMFEILTGKLAPEVVSNSCYIEKIIPKGQKSVDYYAILIRNENSKDKEKLDLKITPLLNDRQS